MQFNRTAIALLSAGALIGTAGVIALQTHAQQSPVQTTSQMQTQTPTVAGDKITPQDTDNIQDPGGIEKADIPNTPAQITGTDTETNDDPGTGTAKIKDNGQDGETNDATEPAVTK
jgi:hypothetical protein